MTIYHPRVGHEIVFVDASASGDPANDVPINVGRTTIMVSPPPGHVFGNPMGGISFSGGTAGDEVLIGTADANYDAINAHVYLPSGDSIIVTGETNFLFSNHVQHNGDCIRLTKIDATHWVFDRA